MAQSETEINYKKPVLNDMVDLKWKHGSEIQYYIETARHIENTDMCMITLPCKNKDKRLMILVAEV
jgi:hypothetical protein